MLHAREDYSKKIQCIDGSIPEDEPVFLLRGQDATAVATVEFWIEQQKFRDDCDHRSIVLAKRHLEKMKEWPVKKTADAPIQENDDPFFDHDCTC